jgi:DnaJ family protein A protein 5
MKNYVEPEWIRNTEEKLNDLSIEGENDESDYDAAADEDEEDMDDEDFFCVACDKSFKSDRAFMNHENSKKHKENIDLLKKTMKEEDLNLFFTNNVKEEVDEFGEEVVKKSNQEEKPKNR